MQPNQTSVTPTNAIENPTTKNGDTDQKSTVIQPSASNIVTPQAVQISNDNADNPTSKGLNTTPVQPMKQVDGTKGIWKWVAKLVSFSNVGSRMKAEMQLEQNYATQHGLQYQSVTQELPTGPDGVGSVILSSGGNTIFYHHMSGKIQNYDYDSVVWFHRHYKTGLSFLTFRLWILYRQDV
jgi:hypothetical protein